MLIRLHSKIAILFLAIVVCLLVFKKEELPKCEYEPIDIDMSYLMLNAERFFNIIQNDTNDRHTARISDNTINNSNMEM